MNKNNTHIQKNQEAQFFRSGKAELGMRNLKLGLDRDLVTSEPVMAKNIHDLNSSISMYLKQQHRKLKEKLGHSRSQGLSQLTT